MRKKEKDKDNENAGRGGRAGERSSEDQLVTLLQILLYAVKTMTATLEVLWIEKYG
jgi:hypothetical protein